MPQRILLRRDTSINWEYNNPVLMLGEPGFETNTGKLKIGNGQSPWSDLQYVVGEIGATGASGKGYNEYIAILTQEPGNPLSVTVLENTIGNIVWTQPSTGTYFATLAGAFPLEKTALFIQNSAWNDTNVTYITHQGTGNVIVVETYDASNTTLTDDLLGYTTVEIRVYP